MKFTATAKQSAGTKTDYIKLGDGETIEGVFRGEPHVFHVVWENGRSKDVPDSHPGAKMRFALNFLTRVNGTVVAKIIEGSGRMYFDLKSLSENGYDLEKTKVRITRTGTDFNNTRYTVLPLPNGTITEDVEKHLSQIKLHVLDKAQL